MEKENWVMEQSPKSIRSVAQKNLDKIKEQRKNKFKIVRVDAKTWKEVPID